MASKRTRMERAASAAGRYQDVAEKLLDVRGISGSEANCICPFHDDSTPSLRFNVETGLWRCWGCNISGTAKGLASRLNKDYSDPAFDAEFIRRKLRALRAGARAGASLSTTNYLQETTLRKYTNFGDTYWTSRGLRPETISTFDLGFDVIRNEAIIPIRDLEGGLTGVIRRNAGWQDSGDGPKYRYPKGWPRKDNLFASWLVAEDHDDWVALVEGPLDCIKVWQAGYPALAIYGSAITDQQVRLLHRLGVTRTCLFFDNDRGGHEALSEVTDALQGSFLVSAVDWTGWPRKADPGGLKDDEIGKLLSQT